MRQIKIIGLILLSIASFIYGYQKPEKVSSTQKSEVYITLEGAFNKTGEVPIKEGMTMSDLVKKVGVKENACMEFCRKKDEKNKQIMRTFKEKHYLCI